MMVRPVLWTLIGAAAGLSALVSGLTQDYTLAALGLAGGALWLLLESRRSDISRGPFLLLYVALAVIASLKDVAPAPLTLLALVCALAAWDLAALQRRTADAEDRAAVAELERRHLQRLGLTISAGFLAALIPLLAQISLPFLVLAALLLVAVIALSRAVAALLAGRDER